MEVTTIWRDAANKIRLHFELTVASYQDYRQFMGALQYRINKLINEDFAKLVNLLYRMDISEQKLKKLLASDTGKDAAEIIAGLLMEREIEKAETRRKYKATTTGISREETW